MLEKEHCMDCKTEIIVVRVSPDPESYNTTGMYAHLMTDDFDYEYLGAICNDCAYKAQSTGQASIGFSDVGFDCTFYVMNRRSV